MARPWSARCYGVARQREGSRQNSIGCPAICSSITLTREGADGQAVVCPLLRGSSPTRGVAPKQQGGSGVLSLRHFGLVLFIPLARGRRRICRGERCKLWLMVSAGAMLLDRLGPPGFRFTDFRAARLPYLSPLARARALMARPWSARCYGVARQREGSRQNGEQGDC